MSRPKALVSIVMPTYNGSRYIEEAIQSCLDQTYPNIELIVVDDASTDGTAGLIARYVKPEGRVSLVQHEQNRRLPGALNTGFARAHGEFLAWTSDDNLYEPDAIAVMADHLATHPDIDLVYCGMKRIGPEGEDLGVKPGSDPELLPTVNCVGACFLYRREVYEAVGDYDPVMFLAEDYEYWLRVGRQFAIARLDATPYRYRSHAGALSAKRSARIAVQSARARCRHVVPAGERRGVLAAAYGLSSRRCRSAGDPVGAWVAAHHCLALSPYRSSHWRAAAGTTFRVVRSLFGARATPAADLERSAGDRPIPPQQGVTSGTRP